MDNHTIKLDWRFLKSSQQCFFAVHQDNNYHVDLQDFRGYLASMSFTWMQQGLSVKLGNSESTDDADKAEFLFPGIESSIDSDETRELQEGNSVYLDALLVSTEVRIHRVHASGDLELDVIATAL